MQLKAPVAVSYADELVTSEADSSRSRKLRLAITKRLKQLKNKAISTGITH